MMGAPPALGWTDARHLSGVGSAYRRREMGRPWPPAFEGRAFPGCLYRGGPDVTRAFDARLRMAPLYPRYLRPGLLRPTDPRAGRNVHRAPEGSDGKHRPLACRHHDPATANGVLDQFGERGLTRASPASNVHAPGSDRGRLLGSQW